MKNTQAVLKIVCLILILTIVALYIFDRIKTESIKPEVKIFINTFYVRYNAKDFAYIYSRLCYSGFKTNISPEAFDKMMGIVYTKLGKTEKIKMTGLRVYRVKKDMYCDMHYLTNYGNGSSKDKFTIRKYNGAWVLTGYHINSKQLMLKK